tara:strand:- start:61 stop:210 length:150 start_codon:yes stop_codon:yes gene_type:complete
MVIVENYILRGVLNMEKNWIKYGVVGSVVWIAILFIISGAGLDLVGDGL